MRRFLLFMSLTAALIASDLASNSYAAARPLEDQLKAHQDPKSGPFGFYMGMTVAELKKIGTLKEDEPGVFEVNPAPAPHPDFERYMVMVSDSVGLCKIIAVGKTTNTSAYGSELKSKFQEVERAIAAKYGKHATLDRLNAGSIWNEPRDWMMGLLKKERSLGALWASAQGSTLTDNIAGITLMAVALSQERGYLLLSYSFDNAEICERERESRANRVF